MIRGARVLLLTLLTCLGGACDDSGGSAPGSAVARAGASAFATDLDGDPFDPFAGAQDGPLVLVFLAAECPVSNRYAPELARIHRAFTPRGARFYRVYPDSADDAEVARRHGGDFSLAFPALLDPAHALVERSGVRWTPEVCVFRGDTLAYRGRIDDRWLALNEQRPAPIQRDLIDALEAVLAGDMPATTETEAVGCLIQR